MKNKGLSFLLCFGSWGGVYIYKEAGSFRICLGWMALTIFFYDVEVALSKILNNEKEI